MRTAVIAALLIVATPAKADSIARWKPYVAEASARFGIPVEWIERVMRAESAGMTTLDGRPIVSRAGATGLMQLMPGTWAEMRARLGLGGDPHDPRDNILAGTFYLRLMYDRFGYPGLFAAYNAGPGRNAEHLETGRTLPGETRDYLVTVAGAGNESPPAIEVRPVDRIFFALASDGAATESEQEIAPSRGLFVRLNGASGRAE